MNGVSWGMSSKVHIRRRKGEFTVCGERIPKGAEEKNYSKPACKRCIGVKSGPPRGSRGVSPKPKAIRSAP